MTREKLIETIQKLLSLATSSNENEAKLAMSRAQELMAKYSIEVNPEDKAEKRIQTIVYDAPPFSMLNNQPFWPVSLKKVVPYVAGEIAPIFGCYSMVVMARAETQIIGFTTNLDVLKHALDSIFNQAYVQYRKGYKTDRSITFAEAFWHSFSMQLQKRFKEHREHSAGLVVYDAVKVMFDEITGGRKTSVHFNASNVAGVNAGTETANSVEIRKGVVATQGGKLLA